MRLPTFSDNKASVKNAALAETYTNKLDKFRTYSYHHIVAVCTDFQLENVAKTFEDVELTKQIITTKPTKDNNGYRILQQINGAEFYILTNGLMDIDIVVDHLVLELSNGIDNHHRQTGANALVSVTGMITFNEPAGVRFMNIFRKICAETKCHSSSLRLVIKTIFTGQTHTGVVDYVFDMSPVLANVQNFKVSITEAGSVYVAELASVVGGITYDPAITSSPGGQLLRGDGTLREVLENLANSYSKDANNNLRTLDPEVAKNKLPIKYEIRFDESIASIAGNWVTKDMRNTRQAVGNAGVPTAVPPNVSLDGAIAYAFESCSEYIKQAASSDEKAFIYKIESALVTTAQEIKALFKIVPFYKNKPNALNEKMKRSEDPESEIGEEDSVIIYDYIFTGHNTDIESFDMHIDEGNEFFQTITVVETYNDAPGTTNYATSGAVASSGTNSPDTVNSKHARSAVAPGANSNQQRSADQQLSTFKEQYDAALDQAMSLNAAKNGAILKTRGHTGWMTGFSINPYKMDQEKEKPFVTRIPFVYLNIMMPVLGGQQDSSVPKKYERYWYKGLWMVAKITTEFTNDGLFSTELQMLAPVSDPTKSKSVIATVSGEEPYESKREEPPIPAPSPKPPFVADTTNGKLSIHLATNDVQLTKDFKLGNLTVTSKVKVGENQPPTQEILDNIVYLAQIMQEIKDQLGIPITISSAFRNERVNSLVGGASNSDHKQGLAADFTSTAMKPQQIVSKIMGSNIPYKMIILETPPGRSPWVHISVSRNKAANVRTAKVWRGGAYLPYTG